MGRRRRKHLDKISRQIARVREHLAEFPEHENTARKDALSETLLHVEELKSCVISLRDDQAVAYEMLPEDIQMSDQGDAMEDATKALSRAVNTLDETIEDIQAAITR